MVTQHKTLESFGFIVLGIGSNNHLLVFFRLKRLDNFFLCADYVNDTKQSSNQAANEFPFHFLDFMNKRSGERIQLISQASL
jgi:hypothetical protein